MMKRVFLFLAFTASSLIHAEQLGTSGYIADVWTYSDKNPMNGVSNVLAVKLNNPFSGGCAYAWIGPSNKTLLTQLALAQATNKTVTLYYDNAIASPWGDRAVCAVVSINISTL